MNYIILILAVSFFNLMATLLILYFIARNYGAIKNLSDESYQHFDRYHGDLLERLRKMEETFPGQTTGNISRDSIDSCRNRIKSAVEKLQRGDNPDRVRGEYGYSKSEMGLLMATAGLIPTGVNDI